MSGLTALCSYFNKLLRMAKATSKEAAGHAMRRDGPYSQKSSASNISNLCDVE